MHEQPDVFEPNLNVESAQYLGRRLLHFHIKVN